MRSTRIENNNLPARFQQHRAFGETFFLYEFFGHNGAHVGNLKKAVAKISGVTVASSETQRGWSNSRAVLRFEVEATLEAKLEEVWKLYNEESEKMSLERAARKGQPKVEKPAPTPRLKKAEKPDKLFECFVMQKELKAYSTRDGVLDSRYKEYPVMRIIAKSYQKAREDYEKVQGKDDGGWFYGSLFVSSREIK